MQKFYLGTYTKRTSNGIYSIELDTEKKELLNLKLEAEIDSPTYLDLDSENNIYTVSNVEKLGGISLIKNGVATSSYNFEIATPCYIAFDEENNYALTSNYHAGTVALYKIIEDELNLLDTITHSGQSIKPAQDKPHVHYSDFTPDKKFIVVCDLGTDELVTYKIVDEKLKKVASYNCAVGAGARHLAFHPTKNIAYLICELEATIEVLNFDEINGTFEKIQEIKLLENNDMKKWAAAVRVTSCGKFLYATNRGADLLVAFKIFDDGILKKIAEVSTAGSVARDFNFDSTEKFIVVAHQESDNLTLFERNSDGTLTVCQKDVFAPEVVCVKLEK